MSAAGNRGPVILLDVMGTIVREPFLEDVPRFFGTPFAELVQQLSREVWFEFERGEIDEVTFAKRFFHDGRTFDCEGLKGALRAGYEYLPGMLDLLRELRACGAEMHALSNYPVWYQLIEDKLGLSQHLAWTFVSCKTGVRKPDAEAYIGAARALGVAASECVFVDDRGANCAAARALGMRAVKFTGAAGLRIELVGLGVLDDA